MAHHYLVNVFLKAATRVYSLPGLNGSYSCANQPQGTCKESCNKTLGAIDTVKVRWNETAKKPTRLLRAFDKLKGAADGIGGGCGGRRRIAVWFAEEEEALVARSGGVDNCCEALETMEIEGGGEHALQSTDSTLS